MKTSEFIKAWNESLGIWQACKSQDGVIIKSKSKTLLDISNDALEINAPCVLTVDRINIINEYLQTPVNERQNERKWVIPWGINSITNDIAFWSNFTGRLYVARVDIDDESWKKDSDYQFTDSEIEKLKSTQTPAIAKAIDIAKELVSDD